MLTTITFVLTGPRAGKTVTLGKRWPFRGGKMRYRGQTENMQNVAHILGTYYQAFPEGSQELREAQEAWAARMEGQDGVSHVQAPAQQQRSPDPVHRSLQSGGEGFVPQAPVDGSGPAPAEGGGVQAVAEGNGESERSLRQALAELNPDNDDHWTQGGRPSLSALQAQLHRPVTRAEVDRAAPRFDRSSAQK